MSKIGIESCKYSVMNANGSYTGPKAAGTLVNYNGSPNKVEAEDWGDNRMVESNRSINKINLSMELNDLEGAVYAELCGHTYETETKKVVVKDTDNAPYVGIGAVGSSERNGALVYVLKFYPKMQFSDPNDDNATGTETRSYTHTTIDGVGYPDSTGTLKTMQEFDTLAAAVAALDTLLAAPTGGQGENA